MRCAILIAGAAGATTFRCVNSIHAGSITKAWTIKPTPRITIPSPIDSLRENVRAVSLGVRCNATLAGVRGPWRMENIDDRPDVPR